MVVASIVVSSLLAVLISYSAVLKLTHRPKVVDDYRRAGVPERWLNRLAALLLAAAVGLVVGNWWPLAGTAAAAGLVAYFALAVGFHVRAKDTKNAATPVVLMLLAIAALGLPLAAL
jgi:ABC-type multidrug transport system permease subunit